MIFISTSESANSVKAKCIANKEDRSESDTRMSKVLQVGEVGMSMLPPELRLINNRLLDKIT